MNRADRMTDLLIITSRLIGCMEKEINLLQTMNPEQMRSIQLDKTALADAYDAHIQALRNQHHDNAVITVALRDELAEATERFRTVLNENARALRAVRDVNDRVLKAIAKAVQDTRGAPPSYTAGGRTPPQRQRHATMAPVTLDQRL